MATLEGGLDNLDTHQSLANFSEKSVVVLERRTDGAISLKKTRYTLVRLLEYSQEPADLLEMEKSYSVIRQRGGNDGYAGRRNREDE